MKYDERDFDAMLENDIAELPPEDIVHEVTPWKRSMHRVLIGLALATLTLNFWCLNYILPTIGTLLMLLGFRTLRKENGWMKGCFILTSVYNAYWFVLLLLNATVYHQTVYNSVLSDYLTVFNLLLQFARLICLWKGIKAVQRKAGLPEHAGGAIGLMIWFGIICVLGIIRYSGIVIAAIVILIYIFAIRSLWKLADEMDEAGYIIEAAPVRIPDRILTILCATALVIGLAAAYIFGSTYRMAWQPIETAETTEITEIKTHLVDLGFPADILDDLTEEDILDCKDAVRVVFSTYTYPVNNGRFVQTTTKDASGYLTFHHSTVYDVKELVITGIAVELSAEREHWKIIHHFRWAEDPGYFGTESLQIWPVYRNGRNGWGKASDFTGRVLYDKDGTSYTAPYIRLGEETYTNTSIFWGESVSTDVFAEFSLPRDGENQRGYIAYTTKEMQDGWIVDSWINYTHARTWAQYPALTAKQHRMANSISDTRTFKTIQDALQFYPEDDELNIFSSNDN